MSSREVAIAARGVSKSYIILHQDEHRLPLAQAVARRLRHPLRRMHHETLWALRDVSFDIHQGEVVGLIGRNGAGKSTLLKLLSRITEPSRGQIGVWGRIGSLLEVGTGFHPQLTGRENIFLNGAILGMRRSEIKSQFDAIVAFSGVEKFLDTPVKRYSSGMHVRLAFAVAVHLRPEILIVDEVLAVGDGDFQRRCMAKMDEVARSGRTILLVSHNMGSIQSLCSRVIYLEDGRILHDGAPDEVVARYLDKLQTLAGSSLDDDPDGRPGDGAARVRAVRVLSESRRAVKSVMGGEDLVLEIDYESRSSGRVASLSLNIYNDAGVAVCAAHTYLTRPDLPPLARRGRFRCRLRRLPLTVGSYRVALAMQIDGKTADHLSRAASIDVAASVFYPTGRALDSQTAAFLLDHAWEHLPEESPLVTEPNAQTVDG
jgi:lipopolysaccharide transport system ATP-binding protein